MSYIEKEPIIEFITKGLNNPNKSKAFGHDAIEILTEIEYAPTADVAEVVRCKDCKFWTTMDNGISWHHQGRTDGECEKLWQLHCAERHLTNKDHFCSYGERKE